MKIYIYILNQSPLLGIFSMEEIMKAVYLPGIEVVGTLAYIEIKRLNEIPQCACTFRFSCFSSPCHT